MACQAVWPEGYQFHNWWSAPIIASSLLAVSMPRDRLTAHASRSASQGFAVKLIFLEFGAAGTCRLLQFMVETLARRDL